MNKRLLCCILVCLLACVSVAALAQETDYSEYIFCEDIPRWTPDPYNSLYPAATQVPAVVTTGQPISVEGNAMTRDLLYDKHTNKQFVTLETRKGNPFFLVIDYDKPKDAAGEQFDTFFLNKVDDADLTALLDDKEQKKPTCVCKNKCNPGAVNVDCPVCSKNMSECRGITPTPTPKPAPTVEPVMPPVPERKGVGIGGISLLAMLLAAGGGAFFYYRKTRGDGKAKQAPLFEEGEGAFEEDDEEELPDEEADA